MNNKCFKFVLIGIILYTAVFTILCSLRYRALFSYEWEDEAAENQLLWNTAHGDFLHQTIYKCRNSMDHFSPIRIFAAFLYRLFPRIHMLYFILSFSFAVSALPLYFLSNHLLKNAFNAMLISFIYLLYPPLHWLNFSSVEPEMLSISLLLCAFYLFFRKKFKRSILFIILSLMCKENIALVIILMAIVFALKKYPLKWSLIMVGIGVIWFLAFIFWIMPTVEPEPESWLACWAGGSIGGIIKFLIFRPLEAFRFMFTSEKTEFMMGILKPLLFLPIFSIEFYISIPIFLQILLFKSPINVESYYLSGAIPFIFIGLIFSMKKIDRFFNIKVNSNIDSNTFILTVLLFICIFCDFNKNIYSHPNKDYINDKRFIGVQNIYDKRFYIKDYPDRLAWKLINMIPGDASVAATGDLLVPLSHRRNILEFAFDDVDDGGGYDYFDVEYIIINKKNKYHGAGRYAFPKEKHFAKLKELIDAEVFEILYEDEVFFLLKRRIFKN